ncbi:MAG: Wzz/FepE/Etk N-terminal domain-containing protein [bacterium]
MASEENNEEINIVSYIRTIAGSWRLILIITVLALIVAGAYYKLSPEWYEIKTVIQLGTIDGQPVINSSEIVSKTTNGVYSAVVFEKTNVFENSNAIEMKHLSVKATIPANTTLLILSTKSTNPELGREFLEGLSAVIVSEEQAVINHNKKIQNDKIEILKDAIKMSENKLELLKGTIVQKNKQLRLLENQLIAVNKSESIDSELYRQVALLNANTLLESSRQQIIDYRLEQIPEEELLNRLKIQFIDLTVDNQKIAEAKALNISDNSRSLRPGILIIAITAIIMGLFLGSFCVLVANWWRVVKKR